MNMRNLSIGGLVLVFGLVACQRTEPQPGASPPVVRSAVAIPGPPMEATSAPVSAPSAEESRPAAGPGKVALEWLHALSSTDLQKLGALTSLPFSFRTTNKIKDCDRTVRDPALLREFTVCLDKHEDLLMKELRRNDSLKLEIVVRKQASSALQPLLVDLKADEMLVTTFIDGDGVTFRIAIVLGAGAEGPRVRVLATNAEFESG